MEIRPYSFDAQLSAGYVRLRSEIYVDLPHIAAMSSERVLARFAPSFAFYGKPENRHRHFAAVDGDRVVGHISAFANGALMDHDGTAIGTLGCFECIEDTTVAAALVDAGLECLAQFERDARVWAPVDFDIWHGYRFRTRGFTGNTYPGEPTNPRWYPTFFEERGFVPRERWELIEVVGMDVLRALAEPCMQRLSERLADGYRFEPVGADADLSTLHRLVMDSFAGFLGFTPLDYAEFATLYGPLWHSIDLRLSGFVFDPAGTPVGFELAYPVGDRVVFYMIGITRSELARRHGLGRAAFADIMGRVVDAGCERVVFALMSEHSFARSGVRLVANQAQTEHTLFELDTG